MQPSSAAETSRLAPIQRIPLRAEVHDALVTEILQGRWPEGGRLREEEVAQVLGVSRTPVREAMQQLVREGILTSSHGHGFRVSPTRLEDVREVYPLVIGLECMAIRSLDQWGDEPLSELEHITSNMESARECGDHALLAELDEQWHGLLIQSARNQRLVAIYQDLKVSVRRYEFMYMSVSQWTRASIQDHRQVVRALRRNNADDACKFLERNWRRTLVALESCVPVGDEPES